MAKVIPIKNIYYLLSYAWDLVELGQTDFRSDEPINNTTDLFARLFDICTSSLIKRGLVREYRPITEEILGVKGKFNINQSVVGGSFHRGSAVCDFDDYTLDNTLNQIVKMSLLTLLKARDLDAENVLPIRRLLACFENVTVVEHSHRTFNTLRLNSHNKHYGFVLKLSELLYQSTMISGDGSSYEINNFLHEKLQMHRLFEDFVRNFYQREQREFRVTRERFTWNVEGDDLFKDKIPTLNTDITLISEKQNIIIDTKFYSEALLENYGKLKFRREHLSQLLDYLRASQNRYGIAAKGILLYPAVEYEMYATGSIEGFTINISTINLSEDWKSIHNKLLSLLQN